jgi:tetratricopeptide (TPR) repeat protein
LRGADEVVAQKGLPGGSRTFKAEILARQGRFRESIEEYTRVIASDPLRMDTYRQRGHVYRRLKEYDKAVADYDRLLSDETVRRAEPWTFYQRAAPLWILGRAEEALDDYRHVRIRLGRPSYGDARRFLILRELGRQGEAERVLGEALRDVENPSWLRNIFRCLGSELTPDALVADAVARDEREHICEAYYYAGEVHLLSGRLEQARKCFEQCVNTGVEFDQDTFPLTPMNEFELAEWRLDTLFSDQSPTSQP